MHPPRCCDRILRAAACLAASVWLAGCAGFTPQPGPEVEPGGNYVPLTMPFVAVGDTQEHESTGFPLHDNDSAIDAYVEVAQRPPQQPLFGRRILEWALQNHPDDPFIHLGDVMDLSCKSEAERMARVFREAERGDRRGAILPGNHDGLMFGIYSYSILGSVLDLGARKWNLGCRRGAAPESAGNKTEREALSKRGFIASYLTFQAFGQHAAAGLAPPPPEGRHRFSWRNTDPQAFLSGIEANLLDGVLYADSFLAQRLKLPRAPQATRDVIIIGLDTNQAGALVGTWDTIMGRSPGSMGHVHPEQITAVSAWVEESVDRGDIVIFAGHHNWRALGLPTRVLLRGLMRKVKHPLVYISAHTHSGFWAVHRALDRRPLLELNVSSLSDWPIAYRRISFAYDESARRLQVKGELMPHGAAPSASYADLLAAWKAQTCKHAGVSPEALRQEDLDLVKRQRESRGSLIQWLLESLSSACETCEQPLYEHAQAYQDAMLTALLELDVDLGREAHQLHHLPMPAFCPVQDFVACARMLMDEKATDFRSHSDLFRRKAALVERVNKHLDDLTDPQAKAYMTCRAVQAARIDFSLTDDRRAENRGEEKRRAEQFFRIEASVGMD